MLGYWSKSCQQRQPVLGGVSCRCSTAASPLPDWERSCSLLVRCIAVTCRRCASVHSTAMHLTGSGRLFGGLVLGNFLYSVCCFPAATARLHCHCQCGGIHVLLLSLGSAGYCQRAE
ncbi:uncharacterized protein LOC135821913 [Sycon ciliatum]|uniref:uncharacterized protein LOC135821913 n=1 Tax=Sycon ciliatum TaxID=27933 RepID=UPI0031F68A3D